MITLSIGAFACVMLGACVGVVTVTIFGNAHAMEHHHRCAGDDE